MARWHSAREGGVPPTSHHPCHPWDQNSPALCSPGPSQPVLRSVSALCSTSEPQTLLGCLLGPLGCPWILLGILTIHGEFSAPLPSLLVKSPPGSLGPLLGGETEGNRGDGKALVPWMISVATSLDFEGLSLEETQTCAWGLERGSGDPTRSRCDFAASSSPQDFPHMSL